MVCFAALSIKQVFTAPQRGGKSAGTPGLKCHGSVFGITISQPPKFSEQTANTKTNKNDD